MLYALIQVVQVNDIPPQEEAPRQIQEASQPAATHIAAENDQQAVPVKLTTEEADEPAATRKSGRPLGISKIDLRTVWGSRTPMPGSETELQEAGKTSHLELGRRGAMHANVLSNF